MFSTQMSGEQPLARSNNLQWTNLSGYQTPSANKGNLGQS